MRCHHHAKQRPRGAAPVVEPFLEDVADADHVEEASAVPHGNMMEVTLGHHARNIREAVIRRAADDRSGRQSRRGEIEQLGSMRGNPMGDIPLGDNAIMRTLVAADDDCADILPAEPLRHLSDGDGGVDWRDGVSF